MTVFEFWCLALGVIIGAAVVGMLMPAPRCKHCRAGRGEHEQ